MKAFGNNLASMNNSKTKREIRGVLQLAPYGYLCSRQNLQLGDLRAILNDTSNTFISPVQAFAGQFDEPSMNHWEEATKVCVLSIIHHARSHSYRTFCVQQAIARRSYKFLAYLLTKIHDEGENAVANLETEYKALTDGGNLNVNLPDWKAEFEKPLDIWTYDQVWMSDVGSVDWFEE
ncbi:hypothetical protein IFR05_017184 [Cadophora sp. M221]|nr:hypothetical protein IFR05_017184 [Cadophora sp. M221]